MAAQPARAGKRKGGATAPARSRAPENKILRIGVIHNGRIIEERLIPATTAVTVGDHPKCTVVVPTDTAPAKRFELFSPRGGQYALQFTNKMHGKVSVGDSIETLATLGKKGLAKKKGTFYALPLTERNRGKVYVGDYTVLFQFVAPPPQPLRRRNSDFRGWRWDDVDWVFLAIMLLSALLHTAAVIWIESQPPPKKLRLEDFPDRFVKLMLPPDPPPAVEAPTDDGEGEAVVADATPEEVAPTEAAPAEAGEVVEEPVESAEDRQARLEDEVSSKGLLAIIGTAGDTVSGNAVADLLSDAGSLSLDVGSALANSSGVAVARRDADQAGLRGGGGGDEAASSGELGGAGGGPGGSVAATKVEIKGNVSTGSADIVSSSPEDTTSVARTMKRYTGRVKQCYEKELKGNPDLGGKVTVSFDIDTSGNVSGTQIAGNTTGNSALGDCIKNVVKRIRFVPPPEEEMEVAGYPFILAKQ